MKSIHAIIAAVGITALVACAVSDAGPRTRDVPSYIILGSDTSMITAPDTVQSGVTFEVRFDTYGGGCTTEGSTFVLGSESDIVLLPMDSETSADVCSGELRVFQHVVQVKTTATGRATVWVKGIDGGRQAAQVTREVIVTP